LGVPALTGSGLIDEMKLNLAMLLALLVLATKVSAQSSLNISVDATHPGAAISPDFTGLSFELTQLLPGPDGLRYFRPDNTRLINLFRTLGIKNLRVGGNTADRNWRRPPDQADIDSLFAFAKAAHVKVIYCLRLHDGDPKYDAQVAKYITDHYPDQIACFSIGQEPTAYPRTTNWVDGVPKRGPRLAFSTYSEEWKKFATAVVKAAPNAKFCGPGTDANPEWPREFLEAFGQGNHVTMITSHLYPGRSGDKVPSPEIGRDEMLSDNFVAAYQRLYDGFGPATLADGLSYRLEEVNNFFNGGASDVSDTFASSLWGLDFMYWWAEHGADGLNFHTGDKVAAGAELRPSRYTAYFSTPDGFAVRPLGYGIKAFDIARRGRFLSATISNPDKLNLSVYSVLGDDKNIYVTIINKEHGANARAASASLTAGATLADPRMMTLTAPNGDVATKTGVTLGGAKIENDGNWAGTWTTISPAKSGILNVTVPAGSANIIKLEN
jgi:Glycosyl hydrolase family 79 C-terminal beta domain